MNKLSQVTILGGFLGSGKTTLLNNILKSLDPDFRTAVIINDFGDVNIDGMIMERGDYSKKEISGGCICCSLKGKLLESLYRILEEEGPEEIYIEATGLAVPWDMKNDIEKSFPSSRLRVRQVLVCVDARQFDRFHGPLPIYKRQFGGSPHILMTKADLYEADIPALEERIRGSYPLVSSLLPVTRGRIDPESLPAGKEDRPAPALIPGLFAGALPVPEKDRIVQLSFQGVLTLSMEELKERIEFCGERLLRLKGVMVLSGGDRRIVHYDAVRFSTEPFTPDEAASQVYSRTESYMTLFCQEEHRDTLEESFKDIFA